MIFAVSIFPQVSSLCRCKYVVAAACAGVSGSFLTGFLDSELMGYEDRGKMVLHRSLLVYWWLDDICTSQVCKSNVGYLPIMESAITILLPWYTIAWNNRPRSYQEVSNLHFPVLAIARRNEIDDFVSMIQAEEIICISFYYVCSSFSLSLITRTRMLDALTQLTCLLVKYFPTRPLSSLCSSHQFFLSRSLDWSHLTPILYLTTVTSQSSKPYLFSCPRFSNYFTLLTNGIRYFKRIGECGQLQKVSLEISTHHPPEWKSNSAPIDIIIWWNGIYIIGSLYDTELIRALFLSFKPTTVFQEIYRGFQRFIFVSRSHIVSSMANGKWQIDTVIRLFDGIKNERYLANETTWQRVHGGVLEVILQYEAAKWTFDPRTSNLRKWEFKINNNHHIPILHFSIKQHSEKKRKGVKIEAKRENSHVYMPICFKSDFPQSL